MDITELAIHFESHGKVRSKLAAIFTLNASYPYSLYRFYRGKWYFASRYQNKFRAFAKFLEYSTLSLNQYQIARLRQSSLPHSFATISLIEEVALKILKKDPQMVDLAQDILNGRTT